MDSHLRGSKMVSHLRVFFCTIRTSHLEPFALHWCQCTSITVKYLSLVHDEHSSQNFSRSFLSESLFKAAMGSVPQFEIDEDCSPARHTAAALSDHTLTQLKLLPRPATHTRSDRTGVSPHYVQRTACSISCIATPLRL